tara:strand:- start:271 stop:444 length:174 start_codon:yes stop_codon:yes gene_type:complete
MKILIIFIILTQIGCAELIGYTIGTTSNVTGDLITKYIEKKKDAKNSPQETDKTNKK